MGNSPHLLNSDRVLRWTKREDPHVLAVNKLGQKGMVFWKLGFVRFGINPFHPIFGHGLCRAFAH